jgi:hypothetical protein
VHVYFHDTDLVDAGRRALLRTLLAVLARRRRPASPLDLPAPADECSWDNIARGRPIGTPA